MHADADAAPRNPVINFFFYFCFTFVDFFILNFFLFIFIVFGFIRFVALRLFTAGGGGGGADAGRFDGSGGARWVFR